MGNRPKKPTAIRPQMPPMACTEIAPQGSSMDSRASKISIASGARKAGDQSDKYCSRWWDEWASSTHGNRSGDPSVSGERRVRTAEATRVMTAVIRAAEPPARVVLMPIRPALRGSIPLSSVAPEMFRPSQPAQAKRQPKSTKTALCAGIAVGSPSAVYLPLRGPRSRPRPAPPGPPPVNHTGATGVHKAAA